MRDGGAVRFGAEHQQTGIRRPGLARGRCQRLRCQHHTRAGVGQHVGQFFGMQLVVDRHRHGPGPHDGVQGLQVLGRIGGVDGHSVTGGHAALRVQIGGQGGSACAQVAVGPQHVTPLEYSGLVGMQQSTAAQQVGDVHSVHSTTRGFFRVSRLHSRGDLLALQAL